MNDTKNKMYVSEQDLVERFEEMLNESYEQVKVLGYTFDPAKVLRECDPVAYRCEKANFADNLDKCGFEVEGY